MKFEITQKGVYDKSGKRVPVGKVLTLKGDEIPSNLVGKGRSLTPVVADDGEDKQAVINPAKKDA
ncbi:MAG: hypothetical protein CML69_15555 [Rhodobacteraceae bacterium]|nr:hypothetical protein [Paracoccaceae bacterium]